MKIYRYVAYLRARDVGPALIERVSAIIPNSSSFHGEYRAEVLPDDARLPLLSLELHRAGLTPMPISRYGHMVKGKEYITGLVARYEEADFAAARVVSLRPGGFPRYDVENIDTETPVARLLMDQSPFESGPFASTNFDHLLTTNAGRAEIERGGFTGAEFVPAFLVHPDTHEVDELIEQVDRGQVPDLGPPPLWEIRPTVVLPPMLPMKYTHESHGEQRPSRNPVAQDRRMAYARTDLDAVGPFDFARPAPGEDGKKCLVDPLIVSQRFFRFMKSQSGFEIGTCTPVREE